MYYLREYFTYFQLKRAQVKVLEPTGMSDNILKFTAGLAVAVPFHAEIDNVEDVQHLRIKVYVLYMVTYICCVY